MGADAVRSGGAGLLIPREKIITRNTYTQGKGELVWDTWPNLLVLRLPPQSENETNDPLKSGPAMAGPAGPATPPLTSLCFSLLEVTESKAGPRNAASSLGVCRHHLCSMGRALYNINYCSEVF